VIEAILDEGLVAHVGICDADGQPYVIPITDPRCDVPIPSYAKEYTRDAVARAS
jgi:hypothetical protein